MLPNWGSVWCCLLRCRLFLVPPFSLLVQDLPPIEMMDDDDRRDRRGGGMPSMFGGGMGFLELVFRFAITVER